MRRTGVPDRPARATASGPAPTDVAIAEWSSCSVSTVAPNPAPVSLLDSWSTVRTRHFCAPVSPPPRARTASGQSSGSSFSATQVMRTAGEPVRACRGA